MPRLYKERSHVLSYLAVQACFQKKWRRNDVLTDIEEWTGRSRYEIWETELDRPEHMFALKYEITDERAMALDDMLESIEQGHDPDLDTVTTRRRRDGTTGKERDIAYLCIRHQLLGHAVALGIEPLLNARYLHCQHASLPGRGPTKLARQVRRALNRKLGIKYFQKTDCSKAYASTQYSKVRAILKAEIPRARWIHAAMATLEKYAPGGHLIIGGYLDARLFNFVMSYALRSVLSLCKSRRGNKIPLVIAMGNYMDDCAFLSSSASALAQAVRRYTAYLEERYQIRARPTTGIIRLWTIEEEKAHKHRATPAARGCPMIDIGGYRIGRSHTTIRRRNAVKAIRCMKRAWREYKATGTLKHQRANSVISRNSFFTQTDSFHMAKCYHLAELLRVAKRIQAYWARARNRKRRERLQNVIDKYREHRAAWCRDDAAPA